MHRLLALLLLGGALFAAAPARAQYSDPVQIQTEAYVNLVQADQSLDAGRLDEALAQYKAARDFYAQLSRDFPGHEPRVIQYRTTYCMNQITDIERRKSAGTPAELPELPPEPSPAPDVIPPTAAAAPSSPASMETTPASDRSVEIDYLKSRIDTLESELAAFDSLQDELTALTAENTQLRESLDTVNRQLAERSTTEQTAVEELRAQLQEKDARIQSLQNDLEAKQQLDQALNDMEASLNDLRAQNDRLNEEIKALDRELDDAETRAEQAEANARSASADSKNAPAAASAAPPASAKSSAKSKPARTSPAEEPRSEDSSSAPVASPVQATGKPQPIPAGMSAADFVRQLLQDGDNETALATVQEARKGQPADMNLLLIEGIALIRLQRYPEAATLLVDLAKHNPRNPEIHATLGAAMMGAGFYEEARETLLMAVKLDKNLPECHYNLAQLYALTDPVNLKLAQRHYKLARDLGIAPDKALEKAMK